MKQILAIALALAASGCAPAPSRDIPQSNAAASPVANFVAGVRRTVLPNGLTVLTREQRGTGIVAVNTWVKAGYFNEPDEVAGMAHLFEHMFFKGSRAYPGPEAIAQAVTGAGGILNAGTIYDSTNYYVVVPKESFARGVEIQADAIAHPLFDPAELRKEAEVVIEESNRKLDNPPAVAFERMLATSFTQHRMKRWRIGSNEVLRNIRRENLVAFFETLYRPENIIVSVAGDVSHEEALAAVQRSFGTIPRGQPRKERGPAEPPQGDFRFGSSQADVKEGYTVLGWHTVPENHADEVTLEVLAGILGGGRSSRFYRAAVRPGGASTVNAMHFTFDDVGVFGVTASHAEANRAEVEGVLAGEVHRMREYGPTAYELAQAKNAAEASFLGELETALEQVQAMSQYESRGSYRDIAARLSRLQSVTARQVQEAARRYLRVDAMTLYQYQPAGAAAATREEVLERIRRADASPAQAPQPIALPELRNSVRPAATDSPPQEFRLSNGATLVVQQKTASPVVAAGFFIRGGRLQETPSNAGITRLMQAVMRRGTTSRSGEAIDREIEFLGTQIGTVTQEDGFGFTFRTIGRFFETAMRIAADVMLYPTFPEDGIAREKPLQVSMIKRSLDSSIERPLQLFRAAMFGDHPYGLPMLGTEATVPTFDRAALQRWWRASMAADRAYVVVVGNVDAADVRRVVEEQLAALPRTAGPLAVPPLPAPPTQVREAIEERDRKQTAMVIGFPIVTPSHPDWSAYRLAQSLTSGLGGTFFAELRGRQSLAYVVFARPEAFAAQGAFIGYLAGEASKEAAAREALLAQIRLLQDQGVQQADLERAKTFFAGTTRLRREASSSLAAEYGGNFLLGLPLDNVDRMLRSAESMTVDHLRSAARKHLGGDNYVYAAVRGKAVRK